MLTSDQERKRRGAEKGGGGVKSCGCLRTERIADLNRKLVPRYYAAHMRLRTARGRAADYSCMDCGLEAREWSLRHGATETHRNSEGGSLYSLNPDDYDPRCAPCHRRYDREG